LPVESTDEIEVWTLNLEHDKKNSFDKRDSFGKEDSFDRKDSSDKKGSFDKEAHCKESLNDTEPAHGGDIYSYARKYGSNPLDFSVNTNPLGLPKGVTAAIRAMSREHCAYPDVYCRDLCNEISKHEKVPMEYVFCGNGAADIIFRIAYGLVPKRALLTAPAFSEYEKALGKVGCQIDYCKLSGENDFKIDAGILERIRNHDILFICNPNNPTGQITDKALLLEIARECRERGCILVIDECFIEFLEQPEQHTLKDEIECFANLIILKAFTKTYAMAGLRLGYCMTSNKSCLEKLSEAGQPWAVSTVAQTAGIAALKESEYISKTRDMIKKERKYLSRELQKAGMKVFCSYANFILFYAAGMPELYTDLLDQGILIRSCDNFVNLSKGYYRIAVKNHSCNRKLAHALSEITRRKISPASLKCS
jgi:threonine-phosphate decarboxylase